MRWNTATCNRSHLTMLSLCLNCLRKVLLQLYVAVCGAVELYCVILGGVFSLKDYHSRSYWGYSTAFSQYQNSPVSWKKTTACCLPSADDDTGLSFDPSLLPVSPSLIGYISACLMSFSWILAPPLHLSTIGDGVAQQASWEMFRALLQWINKRFLLGHLGMSVPIRPVHFNSD